MTDRLPRQILLVEALKQVLWSLPGLLDEAAPFEELVDATVAFTREAAKRDPHLGRLDQAWRQILAALERMDGGATGGPLLASLFDHMVDLDYGNHGEPDDCLAGALFQALELLPEDAELTAAVEALVTQTELRDPDPLELLWWAGVALDRLSALEEDCLGGPLVFELQSWLRDRTY